MGMNVLNGRSLTGLDHLKQSIADILNTPIGSRVMRRDYGSKLFSLIDAPLNRGTLVDIYAATAEALMKWEDRLLVSAVDITSAQLGQITLKITGKYVLDGKTVQLDGIVVSS
ncbi:MULTISPECIES: GPW/gp25 family protein [Acinetobacter]|uniref:GPW/gp25 family protein n=1 Tax=Acinetobacter johnsonii TaxID=40214 RepID=A0A1R7Q9N4_ACIJO|nr:MULTISPECIES: GPW/gp25 family protein [Acinetobacter]MDH0657309.1 GPW/gp25 family protein [Acinetobacter johnsonii]QQT57239.1 GPW/gp25 family protein [Acinetobacter johnsonii]SJX20946.1 Phage baseplate protein with lysozyme-domain [Acinetobacter johnsonii]